MARKTPDAECAANYERMCELFRKVVAEHDRFQIVYGCGVDVGMTNFIVVRRTTYTYSSYAIGFDEGANEIVILPIDRDLEHWGEPFYLKHEEIAKAKISWLSKEINIRDKRLPKKYITFTVQEQLNQDPDEVCLCVKQDEQCRRFHAFFKQQYAK